MLKRQWEVVKRQRLVGGHVTTIPGSKVDGETCGGHMLSDLLVYLKALPISLFHYFTISLAFISGYLNPSKSCCVASDDNSR